MPKLSKRSLQRLEGVHPDLQRVVKTAIEITGHDFGVSQGLRTLEEQKKLFQAGKSQTMKSRHLTGHAVDLMAVAGGKAVWDWPAYYVIADAMAEAARMEDVPLRWGGAWHDHDVRGYDGVCEDLSTDYVVKCRGEGRRPFLDGPHFELPSADYPA